MGADLTQEQAAQLAEELVQSAAPKSGLAAAVDGIINVVAGAGDRLTMLEVAELLGAASIVCQIVTHDPRSQGNVPYGSEVRH